MTAAETAKNPHKGEAESIAAKSATTKNSINHGKIAAAAAARKKTANQGRKNRPEIRIKLARIRKLI